MFFALFSDKVKWRKRNNVVASWVSSGEEVYIVFNHNWGLMAKSEALGLNKDGVFLGRWWWFHVKTLPYCIRIIVGELDEEHHP